MTLNTEVYITEQTDVLPVFKFAQQILNTPEDIEFRREPDAVDPDVINMFNPLGIGLDALLWSRHRVDNQQLYDNESDYQDCWFTISFDTAYGYKDSLGRSCSGLHIELLLKLGDWLDQQGISWSWQNEYTGDIYSGEQRYSGLESMLEAGNAADREWFEGVVKPIIS